MLLCAQHVLPVSSAPIENGAVLVKDGKIADIAAVAGLIDRGTVNLAIAGTYPFDVEQVRAAYTELMGGHVRGKIVITIP